ncbi:hypothetical protein ACTQ45_12095 [Fundicoccus sp. Sow4_D5]|uniref:hypothetical protein n=1 Tax=Fundicoccus sp. Sow4_D5 TaxID=3438782 RepID=UPI003F918CA7
MKLTIGTDDILAVKKKYGAGNAVAGYVEEAKLIPIPIPMPKFYVIVLDERNMTLVQMDMKFREKSSEVIPLDAISSIKVSSMMVKRITVEANGKTYKFLMRPLSIGIGEEQDELLERFESM